MSNEVEISLNISEIARDSSTPPGMTKTVRYRTRAVLRAFTIIELLVVIAIIIILAGLILSTVGYVQKKGARSRAEAEIAAMSAALESYKADNGLYPTDQTQAVTAIRDPFGYSYGYSTVKSSNPSGTDGYNPTFDLWSTSGII